MFTEEDFQLSLEKQLKLRVMIDEIEGCNNIEVLRSSLSDTATQLMKYQHLLTVLMTKQLKQELSKLLPDSAVEE